VDPATAAPAPEHNLDDLLGYYGDPQTPITVDPSHVTAHIGYLKEMGLDYGWGPTAMMEWIFEHIFLYSGWEWGGAIVAGTVVVRLLSLYPLIRMSDGQAKLAAVRPLIAKLQTSSTEAKLQGNVNKANLYKQEIAATYKAVGANMYSSLGGMALQGVLGFGAFRLLRGMANLPVPGIENMGFLWFSDLTTNDPYYILPLAVGGFMHLMARVRST
jgi:YidC/Oxa1 family membrane protein insertase